MCRTVHALLQTLICGIQMLVRVFMTVILMIENLIRMILQTLYNFISFLLQMLSLIPICVVFLLTARLKCFMCGGGGPCPVNRGGACDCIMSALAIVILFFIFRAAGIMDKLFYSMGYTKARIPVHKFVPTPGDITECSRNDTEYEEVIISTTMNETEELMMVYTSTIAGDSESPKDDAYIYDIVTTPEKDVYYMPTEAPTQSNKKQTNTPSGTQNNNPTPTSTEASSQSYHNWTTLMSSYTVTPTGTT